MDQVSDEGFILSRNADFSTDDRVFAITDTLYIEVWSGFIDYNNLGKKEYKVEDSEKQRRKGNLTNHFDGTYTTEVSLAGLNLGTAKVEAKVEDNDRKKFQISKEFITIVKAP